MKNLKLIAFYSVLLAFTALYLGPFLFSISISFNADKDVFEWPIELFPSQTTLDNYKAVWNDLPFSKWFQTAL